MKLETDFNNVKEAVKANIPFKSGETIIVKLHFGEPGNANTFEQSLLKKLVMGY